MDTATFRRLDNSLWAIISQPKPADAAAHTLALEAPPNASEPDGVRIKTPNFSLPDLAYQLALIAKKTLTTEKISTAEKLTGEIELNISGFHASLNGKWKLAQQEAPTGIWNRFKQWIPFTHVTVPKKRGVIEAVKIESSLIARYAPKFLSRMSSAYTSRISSFLYIPKLAPIKVDITATACSDLALPALSGRFNPKETLSTRLTAKAFSDPFSQLAARSFQTVETKFVSERALAGGYRYILEDNGTLKLEKKLGVAPAAEELDQNRKATQAFKEFAIQEYGISHIEFLQHFYGFSFDEMIKTGAPLMPDHVFKTNIGVNNIELQHVEEVYQKLVQLRESLKSGEPRQSALNVLGDSSTAGATPASLSIREMRGLVKLYEERTGKGKENEPRGDQLKGFLQRILPDPLPKSARELSPAIFNALTHFVMPELAADDAVFTGRKITHLAPCGYKTMGDRNVFDPSRALHELLQSFPAMQKQSDWPNFFEMLSHVAVKKNLFSAYPPTKDESTKEVWRVGQLLPGPRLADGSEQWYYVDTVSDDNEGDLNYTLVPTTPVNKSSAERPAPFIKLYRSTASDPEASNAADSVDADLNPGGAPGSLNPNKADNYENADFKQRTIPVWVGYLLHGQKMETDGGDPAKIAKAYKTALAEHAEAAQRSKKISAADKAKIAAGIQETISKAAPEELSAVTRDLLLKIAHDRKELPEYKIAQDIIHAGHSLGASLAQFGMVHFGAKRNRLPCPGFNYMAYSFDPPMTTTATDKLFMGFGRKHSEVIQGLGQQWTVRHQMEYGDIVPLGGQSHLGTNGYDPQLDAGWLSVPVQVFKPIEDADAMAIRTMPTHGRRIGHATEGTDYTLTKLTANKLYNFDHAWWLTGDLLKTFGYKFARSPMLSEAARRTISIVRYPFSLIAKRINDYRTPPLGGRDSDGVFFCRYKLLRVVA